MFSLLCHLLPLSLFSPLLLFSLLFYLQKNCFLRSLFLFSSIAFSLLFPLLYFLVCPQQSEVFFCLEFLFNSKILTCLFFQGHLQQAFGLLEEGEGIKNGGFRGDGKDSFSTYKVDSIYPSPSPSFPSATITFSHPSSGENIVAKAPSGFILVLSFFFSFVKIRSLIAGNLSHQHHEALDWQEQLLTAMMQDHCLGQGNAPTYKHSQPILTFFSFSHQIWLLLVPLRVQNHLL